MNSIVIIIIIIIVIINNIIIIRLSLFIILRSENIKVAVGFNKTLF